MAQHILFLLVLFALPLIKTPHGKYAITCWYTEDGLGYTEEQYRKMNFDRIIEDYKEKIGANNYAQKLVVDFAGPWVKYKYSGQAGFMEFTDWRADKVVFSKLYADTIFKITTQGGEVCNLRVRMDIPNSSKVIDYCYQVLDSETFASDLILTFEYDNYKIVEAAEVTQPEITTQPTTEDRVTTGGGTGIGDAPFTYEKLPTVREPEAQLAKDVIERPADTTTAKPAAPKEGEAEIVTPARSYAEVMEEKEDLQTKINLWEKEVANRTELLKTQDVTQDQVNFAKNKLDELQGQLTENQQDLEAAVAQEPEKALADYNLKKPELEEEKVKLQKEIEQLEGDMANISDDENFDQIRFTEVENKLKEAKTKLQNTDTELTTLDKNIKTTEQKIITTAKLTEDPSKAIDSLTTTKTQNQTELDALQAKNDELFTDINDYLDSNNYDKAAELEKQRDENNKTIANLKSNITVADQRIAVAKKVVAQQAAEAEAAKKEAPTQPAPKTPEQIVKDLQAGRAAALAGQTVALSEEDQTKLAAVSGKTIQSVNEEIATSEANVKDKLKKQSEAENTLTTFLETNCNGKEAECPEGMATSLANKKTAVDNAKTAYKTAQTELKDTKGLKGLVVQNEVLGDLADKTIAGVQREQEIVDGTLDQAKKELDASKEKHAIALAKCKGDPENCPDDATKDALVAAQKSVDNKEAEIQTLEAKKTALADIRSTAEKKFVDSDASKSFTVKITKAQIEEAASKLPEDCGTDNACKEIKALANKALTCTGDECTAKYYSDTYDKINDYTALSTLTGEQKNLQFDKVKQGLAIDESQAAVNAAKNKVVDFVLKDDQDYKDAKAAYETNKVLCDEDPDENKEACTQANKMKNIMESKAQAALDACKKKDPATLSDTDPCKEMLQSEQALENAQSAHRSATQKLSEFLIEEQAKMQFNVADVIPGYKIGEGGIIDVFNNVIRILAILISTVVVFVMVVGGVMMLVAGGNESTFNRGKNAFIAGAVGLVIVLMAYLIVIFVQSFFYKEGPGEIRETVPVEQPADNGDAVTPSEPAAEPVDSAVPVPSASEVTSTIDNDIAYAKKQLAIKCKEPVPNQAACNATTNELARLEGIKAEIVAGSKTNSLYASDRADLRTEALKATFPADMTDAEKAAALAVEKANQKYQEKRSLISDLDVVTGEDQIPAMLDAKKEYYETIVKMAEEPKAFEAYATANQLNTEEEKEAFLTDAKNNLSEATEQIKTVEKTIEAESDVSEIADPHAAPPTGGEMLEGEYVITDNEGGTEGDGTDSSEPSEQGSGGTETGENEGEGEGEDAGAGEGEDAREDEEDEEGEEVEEGTEKTPAQAKLLAQASIDRVISSAERSAQGEDLGSVPTEKSELEQEKTKIEYKINSLNTKIMQKEAEKDSIEREIIDSVKENPEYDYSTKIVELEPVVTELANNKATLEAYKIRKGLVEEALEELRSSEEEAGGAGGGGSGAGGTMESSSFDDLSDPEQTAMIKTYLQTGNKGILPDAIIRGSEYAIEGVRNDTRDAETAADNILYFYKIPSPGEKPTEDTEEKASAMTPAEAEAKANELYNAKLAEGRERAENTAGYIYPTEEVRGLDIWNTSTKQSEISKLESNVETSEQDMQAAAAKLQGLKSKIVQAFKENLKLTSEIEEDLRLVMNAEEERIKNEKLIQITKIKIQKIEDTIISVQEAEAKANELYNAKLAEGRERAENPSTFIYPSDSYNGLESMNAKETNSKLNSDKNGLNEAKNEIAEAVSELPTLKQKLINEYKANLEVTRKTEDILRSIMFAEEKRVKNERLKTIYETRIKSLEARLKEFDEKGEAAVLGREPWTVELVDKKIEELRQGAKSIVDNSTVRELTNLSKLDSRISVRKEWIAEMEGIIERERGYIIKAIQNPNNAFNTYDNSFKDIYNALADQLKYEKDLDYYNSLK